MSIKNKFLKIKIKNMKKLIILSAAVLVSVAVFAQDTIPGKAKDSMQKKINRADTTLSRSPKKWTKDSANAAMDTMAGKNSSVVDTLNPTALNGDSILKNMKDTSKSIAVNPPGNSNTMSDSTAEKTVSDRVVMRDEKMYLIKNGENTLMDKSYKLESGAVVGVNGTVKFPSGKMVQLKNGQFIELKPIRLSIIKRY